MDSSNGKDKRKHIRIPLLSEAVTFQAEADDKVITQTAQLHDITVGGVFIKTTANLKPKNYISLDFKLPGDMGIFTVMGIIVRKRWAVSKKDKNAPLGVAVEFIEMNAATKKVLDAYVIYLRNKQIITVSKKIIEEFFGKGSDKLV